MFRGVPLEWEVRRIMPTALQDRRRHDALPPPDQDGTNPNGTRCAASHRR